MEVVERMKIVARYFIATNDRGNTAESCILVEAGFLTEA